MITQLSLSKRLLNTQNLIFNPFIKFTPTLIKKLTCQLVDNPLISKANDGLKMQNNFYNFL